MCPYLTPINTLILLRYFIFYSRTVSNRSYWLIVMCNYAIGKMGFPLNFTLAPWQERIKIPTPQFEAKFLTVHQAQSNKTSFH